MTGRKNNIKLSKEEQQYLKEYRISDFERPSVTTDIAVFSCLKDDEDEDNRNALNFRKDPDEKLCILLVRRGHFPYKGYWGLPGGFMRPDESTEVTALRELRSETGVEFAYLHPLGVYSEPGRDPRGWIISHGFFALIDKDEYRIRNEKDAWDARWFSIRMRMKKKGEYEFTFSSDIDINSDEEPIVFKCVVKEDKTFVNHHSNVSVEVFENGELAFDHARMIFDAYMKLNKEAGQYGKIIFDLMPEKFTLYSLQNIYEIILGKNLITPNFRRKIAPLVIRTDEEVTGAGHRPARLFKRNIKVFLE